MQIELIVDIICLSNETVRQMVRELESDFPDCDIIITEFETEWERLKKLGINILPVWLIDSERLEINPYDYASLCDSIQRKMINHVIPNS